ncbi:MAG: hypothetical protein LBI63_05705 [Candidatus Ancillula sp.]|nr:hypothetical protein [Candidatus Ancillula sp.]
MRIEFAPSYKYMNTDDKSNADTCTFLEDVQKVAYKEHPNNQQDANLEVATYIEVYAVYKIRFFQVD